MKLTETYSNMDFMKFVNEKGLKNIRVKDLETIIDEHGIDVLNLVHFNNVYKYVSEKKSTDTMNYLTYAIAAMTLITTICTVIGIFNK